MSTFPTNREKRQLRKILSKKIKSLSSDEIKRESDRLIAQVVNRREYKDCDALFAYFPLEDEIDICPLLEGALRVGTKVLLPRIRGREMDFFAVTSLSSSQLEKNGWGIWEPKGEGPRFFPRDFISPLMIVPGVAFSMKGERMGRGGGFYDRYLSENSPTLLAMALPFQVMKNLPTEKHDKRVDVVIY